VALAHAPMADRDGNVWVGLRREIMTMAHASKTTLVTVERLFDGNLMTDPQLAPGTLPSLYVDAVSVQERGCWPLGFPDEYETDVEHMELYVAQARSAAGFAAYLDEFVLADREAAE